MKIIFVDPNLVRNFLGNNFLDTSYGATLENNFFLMRADLGHLR